MRIAASPHTGFRDTALDGLRGAAVLSLVAATYCDPLAPGPGPGRALVWLAAPGWAAGMIFLALSGFLLTGSVWETLHAPDSPHPAHWLRNFYARRALRIFPLYYLLLLIATPLAVARGTRLIETGPIKLYAWFVENLPFLTERATEQPSPLHIQHLWMVAVMAQLTVVWPLLLLTTAGRRRARSLALGVVLSSVAFCWVVWFLPSMLGTVREHVLDEFPLTYASAFGLGAALYLVRGTEQWEQLRSRLPVLLALGLAGFGLAGAVERGFQHTTRGMFLAGVPAAGLAAAALVGLALEPGPLRRVLATSPLVWLGRLSYGIFLLHPLLFAPADKIAERLIHSAGFRYGAARLAIGIVLSVTFAFLSYELLERPILSLRRRFPISRPRI